MMELSQADKADLQKMVLGQFGSIVIKSAARPTVNAKSWGIRWWHRCGIVLMYEVGMTWRQTFDKIMRRHGIEKKNEGYTGWLRETISISEVEMC